jgi:acetyl-CoA carboxylase carboxyl transferase subunit beta
MQEGAIALMQMAKTSAAVASMGEARLLTVSLVTDPTYGGVAASYATNTDVLLAEPGARLGFAGPRVIRQTIAQELPAGFQTAEFLLKRGQVDAVVERRDLRSHLSRILSVAGSAPRALPHGEAGALVLDPDRLAERDPWEVVRLVRDPARPTTLDYLDRVFDGFVELHGDRQQGDCAAVVAGLGRLDGVPVAVVGTEKGHTTRELVARNFGMPRPAGYRKAMRVMRLAARLGLPVVTLVDTPGAFPGVDAEAGGQMVAIAQNILQLTTLPTPVVAVITGEGGSGGALALAVADRVLMVENGTYSVISPEGCSAILWSTPTAAPEAARALRLTAPELLRLQVVDGVVPEPPGGAQRDIHTASENLRRALHEALGELLQTPSRILVQARQARFRRYGATATAGRQARGGEGAAA